MTHLLEKFAPLDSVVYSHKRLVRSTRASPRVSLPREKGVATDAGITKKTAANALGAISRAIHTALKKKTGYVRISDEGTFKVSQGRARAGVNPRTGRKIKLSPVEGNKVYTGRDEVEYRIKEGKTTFRRDRTGCNPIAASSGRLFTGALVYNILCAFMEFHLRGEEAKGSIEPLSTRRIKVGFKVHPAP